MLTIPGMLVVAAGAWVFFTVRQRLGFDPEFPVDGSGYKGGVNASVPRSAGSDLGVERRVFFPPRMIFPRPSTITPIIPINWIKAPQTIPISHGPHILRSIPEIRRTVNVDGTLMANNTVDIKGKLFGQVSPPKPPQMPNLHKPFGKH